MACPNCNKARAIIKNKIEEKIMQLFGGDSEPERRAAYLGNILGTYQGFKNGDLPYRWFGFVVVKTCEEFKAYFPDAKPLISYLDKGILRELEAYEFQEADGALFQTLVDKFGPKRG
jgi:hypothetical protein